MDSKSTLPAADSAAWGQVPTRAHVTCKAAALQGSLLGARGGQGLAVYGSPERRARPSSRRTLPLLSTAAVVTAKTGMPGLTRRGAKTARHSGFGPGAKAARQPRKAARVRNRRRRVARSLRLAWRRPPQARRMLSSRAGRRGTAPPPDPKGPRVRLVGARVTQASWGS